MKQAVVLIHGIGEQYPMQTLRSFVQTMWTENTDLHKSHSNASKYFVAHSDYLSNYDLRRITSSRNKYGVKTEFYEYYWAHLMEGNKMSHIFKWVKRILFSNPFKLPRPLNFACFFIISVLVGIAILLFWINNLIDSNSALFLALKILILPIVLASIILTLEQYVGDAARYLDPSPQNVHVRERIRKDGVAVLNKLKSKGYEKIVLVGHSLGSVIAYDIINYA